MTIKSVLWNINKNIGKKTKTKLEEYDQKKYWENVEHILERQKRYREVNKDQNKRNYENTL